MSLDLYLRHEVCGICGDEEEVLNFNYTYNVSPMWYHIYPDDAGMVDIDGMTGKEAHPKLTHAKAALLDEPEFFENLNPPNEWGSYKGFLEFIDELIDACLKYPDLKWEAGR